MIESPERLYRYLVNNDYIYDENNLEWKSVVFGEDIIFVIGDPDLDYDKNAEHESEILLNTDDNEIKEVREFRLRLPTIEAGKGRKLKNEIDLSDNFVVLHDGSPMSYSVKGKDTPHIFSKDRADVSDVPEVIDKVTEWYWEKGNYDY